MTTADSPVVEDVEMAAPADEKVGVNVGVKQNNHDMAREENGSHTGIVYGIGKPSAAWVQVLSYLGNLSKGIKKSGM